MKTNILALLALTFSVAARAELTVIPDIVDEGNVKGTAERLRRLERQIDAYVEEATQIIHGYNRELQPVWEQGAKATDLANKCRAAETGDETKKAEARTAAQNQSTQWETQATNLGQTLKTYAERYEKLSREDWLNSVDREIQLLSKSLADERQAAVNCITQTRGATAEPYRSKANAQMGSCMRACEEYNTNRPRYDGVKAAFQRFREDVELTSEGGRRIASFHETVQAMITQGGKASQGPKVFAFGTQADSFSGRAKEAAGALTSTTPGTFTTAAGHFTNIKSELERQRSETDKSSGQATAARDEIMQMLKGTAAQDRCAAGA